VSAEISSSASLASTVARVWQVTVQLFKTRAAGPRYTDDEGCEPVGELAVDVSETVGQAERPLALLFYFGRSQIQVEAIDLTTGKKFQAAIGFEQVS
jgi:hypothetical protein